MQIDDRIIDEYATTIGANGFFVYALLAKVADRNRQCSPSLNYIAEKLGCCRHSVTNGLKLLEEHGLITRTKRQGPSGNIPTLYTLLTSPRTVLTPPVKEVTTSACLYSLEL